MRKLTFFSLLTAMTILCASCTVVLAADTSTPVTTSGSSTDTGDGTVVTQPPTTPTSGDGTTCGDDTQGTDGSDTSSTDSTGTSDGTDGASSGDNGTLTLNLNLRTSNGQGNAKDQLNGKGQADHGNGKNDHGNGKNDHGNGKNDQSNGTGSTDDQSSDSTACHGNHKGWSQKIQNILKHVQEMQTVPGDLQAQLDTLKQWAEQNGSETDVQALQDIEAALEAQASSGNESTQDLKLLATTQDNLHDVDGSITTLEKAMQSDSSDPDVASQLANQYAKKRDKTIKVYIKGQKPNFDVTPTIINAHTMVPLRAVGDALKADVQWDAKTSTITLANENGTVVKLKTGSKVAEVDGQQVTLEAPATVQNGRTLVPLRALGNFFGLNVQWYQNADMAVLN